MLIVRKMLDLDLTLDDFLDSSDFLASYTQYHALVPGQIETWNLIIDGKGVALSEFPMKEIFGIVRRL